MAISPPYKSCVHCMNSGRILDEYGFKAAMLFFKYILKDQHGYIKEGMKIPCSVANRWSYQKNNVANRWCTLVLLFFGEQSLIHLYLEENIHVSINW